MKNGRASRLNRIDVGKFSEALETLYHPVPLEEFPLRLFSAVSSLLPEVMMSFDEVSKRTGQLRHARNFEPPEPEEWLDRLAVNLQRDHPGMAYLRRGGTQRILQLSDFVSQRQLRETALYRENFLAPGIEHQVAIVLPSPDYFAGLAINRGGKFSDVELQIVRLLSVHVALAHANARLCSARTATDAKTSATLRDVPAFSELTPRECEILHWVAQGKRNSEIAGILGISDRTVGKHVQSILFKLRVETRTAAAAEALRLSGPAA